MLDLPNFYYARIWLLLFPLYLFRCGGNVHVSENVVCVSVDTCMRIVLWISQKLKWIGI